MAASSEIEKLERRYAENPDGRYFAPLADAYRKAGQVDRALEVVRAGLEKHPDYLSAHIVLGRCLLDKKEDDGAGQAFERVLGLDAENIIALKSLSEIAERRGEPLSARQWLQKLLQVDPMNAEADADLQRLGGAIAAAPTAPMEALPADLGSERPSEFSFADVTPGEPGADALPEVAQAADLTLEPLPSDAPAQVESVVPSLVGRPPRKWQPSIMRRSPPKVGAAVDTKWLSRQPLSWLPDVTDGCPPVVKVQLSILVRRSWTSEMPVTPGNRQSLTSRSLTLLP